MNTNVYNPSFCSAPSEQLQQLKSKADSTNIRITHSLKGLCHSQSVIHAQGYQQVLGNVESIRWRIAQNVSDKTNLHKTVKAKKAGKHSMGKNYSLYPLPFSHRHLVLSFSFVCFSAIQSPYSLLCCFQLRLPLDMPGYQIYITVGTQEPLSALLLMLRSQNWAATKAWLQKAI